MSETFHPRDVEKVASDIFTDTEVGHALRRKYSRKLKVASPVFVLELARVLFRTHGQRWLACELIRHHDKVFSNIGEREVEEFGQGINSWGSVDQFARSLAGPAWLAGQISDELIHRWACSEDRWWRRAALVSTVALNVRSHGGKGDVKRTLQVCRPLVGDNDDMVFKALSWALRALVVHNPDKVSEFLNKYQNVLAAQVKREVRNKLSTGLKNPKKKLGDKRFKKTNDQLTKNLTRTV
jgi:3-methyladenine DNA glycosylase AlkD